MIYDLGGPGGNGCCEGSYNRYCRMVLKEITYDEYYGYECLYTSLGDPDGLMATNCCCSKVIVTWDSGNTMENMCDECDPWIGWGIEGCLYTKEGTAEGWSGWGIETVYIYGSPVDTCPTE